MDVRMPGGEAPSNLMTAGDLAAGQTFRATSGNTVWMVTQNQSKDPVRKKMVRTVSLKAGSVAYKQPDMPVIRVVGHFQVSDWGDGGS